MPVAVFQQMVTAGINAGVLQALRALHRDSPPPSEAARPDRQEDRQMVRPEVGAGEGQREW